MLIPKQRLKKRRIAARWTKLLARLLNIYFDSIIVQLSILAVTLLSCIWYILGTYSGKDQSVGMEVFFFSVFFWDYIMCIIAAQRKFDYMFSTIGLADLISMLPIISIDTAVDPTNHPDPSPASWIGFLRFLRILNIFHLFRLRNASTQIAQHNEAAIALNLSEVSYQIGRLVVSILVFILVATGVVFATTVFEIDAFYKPFEGPMTWFDCLYFVVVTVTTVGYGDISPNSVAAKLISIFIILFGFALIPSQIAALATVLYQRPKYIGTLAMSTNTQHICVCGIVDYELLYRLLTEIFHPTHAPATIGAKIIVVVLSPVLPSRPVEVLLRLSSFRCRVKYFVGSSKSPMDLCRVKAEDSLAIYLVSDAVTTSLRNEEDAVFLSAISVSRYLDFKLMEKLQQSSKTCCKVASDCMSNFFFGFSEELRYKETGLPRNSLSATGEPIAVVPKTILCHTRPRTMVKLTSSARKRAVLTNCGIDIILSLQEFKYTIAAYGAIFPGFLSLFLNLNRSRTSAQSRQKWRQPESFYEGTRFCLHQMSTNNDMECRPSLRIMSFRKSVSSLYSRSGGLVFLVAVKYRGKVLINPSNRSQGKTKKRRGDTSEHPRYLGDCEAAFLISPSWEKAWEVMTEEDEGGSDGSVTNNNIPEHKSTMLGEDLFKLNRSATSLSAWPSLSGENSTEFQTPLLSPEAVDSRQQTQTTVDEIDGIIKIRRLNSCVTSIMRNSKIDDYDRSLRGKEEFSLKKPSIMLVANSQAPSPRDRPPNSRSPLFPSTVPLKNHVVLIMSSIGRSESLTANMLMLPIIFFIRAVRAQSSESIVVLCEQAEEFSTIAAEIEEANPRLLDNVFFFSGVARNPEHLILCGVERARVVAIIRPPRAAEASEEGSDVSKSVMVNADRHTIITSLSLHMIQQEYQMRHQEEDIVNSVSKEAFTVCELVHESNIVFLREQGQTQAVKGDQETFRRTPYSHSISNSFFVDDTTTDYYDWPLLAAGCILSHTLLDALMVQAIYNPDIISFWEALTGTGKQGNCSPPANTFCNYPNDSQGSPARGSTVATLSPMKLRRSLSDICFREKGTEIREVIIEERKKNEHSLRRPPCERIDTLNGQGERSSLSSPSSYNQSASEKGCADTPVNLFRAQDEDTKEGFPVDESQGRGSKTLKPVEIEHYADTVNGDDDDKTKINSDFPFSGGRPSSFDKVDIPQIFVGKTFGHLFDSFLEHDGAIAIALYRAHHRQSNGDSKQTRTSSSTLLPIVVTAPAMETILLSTDEVFILRRTFLTT